MLVGYTELLWFVVLLFRKDLAQLFSPEEKTPRHAESDVKAVKPHPHTTLKKQFKTQKNRRETSAGEVQWSYGRWNVTHAEDICIYI